VITFISAIITIIILIFSLLIITHIRLSLIHITIPFLLLLGLHRLLVHSGLFPHDPLDLRLAHELNPIDLSSFDDQDFVFLEAFFTLRTLPVFFYEAPSASSTD
jgi:hypothetical protein